LLDRSGFGVWGHAGQPPRLSFTRLLQIQLLRRLVSVATRTGVHERKSQVEDALHGGKQGARPRPLGRPFLSSFHAFPSARNWLSKSRPGVCQSKDLGRSGGDRSRRLVEPRSKTPDPRRPYSAKNPCSSRRPCSSSKADPWRSSFVPIAAPAPDSGLASLGDDRLANPRPWS